EERVVLGQEVAEAYGAVHLGVRAVADDLVHAPLAGGGPPLDGVVGHEVEGVVDPERSALVLIDALLSLGRGHAHGRLLGRAYTRGTAPGATAHRSAMARSSNEIGFRRTGTTPRPRPSSA